jgi:hypothetical protein
LRRRSNIASRKGFEELLLLLRVGDLGEQVEVAFIRCGNIERGGAEQ